MKIANLPYSQYFGEIEIPEAEKRKRIKTAESAEKIISVMLTALADFYKSNHGLQGFDKLHSMWTELVADLVNVFVDAGATDTYATQYVTDTFNDIDDSMKKASSEEKAEDKDYLGAAFLLIATDEEFADYVEFLTEEMTETNAEEADFQSALRRGMTRKKWVTMRDRRVRRTHHEVEGEVVGITELFLVGEAILRFPRDVLYGYWPEEVCNCRCHCKYLP